MRDLFGWIEMNNAVASPRYKCESVNKKVPSAHQAKKTVFHVKHTIGLRVRNVIYISHHDRGADS